MPRPLTTYEKIRLVWPVQGAATIIFLTGLVGLLALAGTGLANLLSGRYITLHWEYFVVGPFCLVIMRAARGLLQVNRTWRRVCLVLLWAGVLLALAGLWIDGRALALDAAEPDQSHIGLVFAMIAAAVLIVLVFVVPLLLLTVRNAVQQFGLPYSKTRRQYVLAGIGAALLCVAAAAASYLS